MMFKTILELLDFNAPGDWVDNGDEHIKHFEIDDEWYEIVVSIDDSLSEPFGRLSFSHLKDGVASMDLTGRNKHAPKIFGTVINSCRERFSDLGAMVFFAKEPERVSLYRRLVRRAQSDLHMNLETAKRDGGEIFALTKPGCSLRLSDFVGDAS
jgi:hypothetical protein